MEFLVQLWQGLVDVWRRLDASARTTVIASGAIAVAAVVVMSLWSAQPDYRMLWTNLSSEDADAIIADLDSRGVPHKLADGGSTILVPADQVYTLRTQLAESGMGKSGKVVGPEIFDRTNLGATEFVQNVQLQRATAGALTRTIESYAAVKRASVHLSMPRERLLATEQQEPSASVVLSLTHPGALSQSQVRGLLNIVASSVPGLKPERVAMTDTDGNILAKPIESNGPLALSDRQREIVAETEQLLEQKIDKVIGKMFAHRAVAVSAELNFDQIEKNETIYDSENPAKISEQITSESTETATLAPSSTTGPTAGLPPSYQSSAATSPPSTTTSKEETIVNYQVPTTITRTVTAPGSYKRISATVLVEPTDIGSDGKPVFRDLTDDELTKCTQLVEGAIPYDASRNDQVVVVAAPFSTPLQPAPMVAGIETGTIMQDAWRVIQQRILPIIVMLVALLYVRRTLVRSAARVPAMPEQVPEEDVSAEVMSRRRVAEEVERMLTQKPDVVASLIKSWLTSED